MPKKKHIKDVASSLNIPEEALIVYGNDKAKINYNFLDSCKDKKDGKLILVTAISPTPAGEGKTTTSVGLVDGLCHIGKKSMICLREPSLGPCFGMKGGAAGGGTRMRKGLDMNEVLSLAKTMEVKFTVSGPSIGGAKSGINFDPNDPRKRGVLERWYKAVTPLL